MPNPKGEKCPHCGRIHGAIGQERIDWQRLLLKMDDRASVICGATRIDVELAEIIRSTFLVPGTEELKNDSLFGMDRPLGSFSARIKLAYRMGLIVKTIYQTIECIRKLRNDFAHSIEPLTLDAGKAKNRVDSIAGFLNDAPLWKHFADDWHGKETNNMKFSVAIVVISSWFYSSSKHPNPRKNALVTTKIVMV